MGFQKFFRDAVSGFAGRVNYLLFILLFVLNIGGWLLLYQHKAQIEEVAITMFQYTQLEIVRSVARSITSYVTREIKARGDGAIPEIEQEIFKRFVKPVLLLKHGDAWIYAPDHVVYDLSSDFPDEYRGRSMAEIFAIQKVNGAAHYKEMTEAVMSAKEGVGWYIWMPDKGREIAAWTPVRVGSQVWTIGLSTPLPEILESAGTLKQIATTSVFMWAISIFSVLFLAGWNITQKRAGEDKERMKASEKNYRQIFNSANEAIFVHDMETGDILDVNRTMCRMFGYSYAEALTLKVGDISSGERPYTQMMAVKWLGKATEEGPQIFEWLGKRKNGETFWLEINLKKAEVGGQQRILAVGRDITKRKQAEEALRESEERFRRFIDATAFEGIILTDEGIIRDINDQFARMYGYERDELIGIKAHDIIAPEYREIVRKYIRDRYEGPYEAIALRKDGSTFPIEVHAKTIYYHGKMMRAAAVRDMTERKRSEKEVIQTKEQWERTFDAVPDLIAILDDKHRIIRANRAMAHALGMTPDEAIGLTCYEHVHGTKTPTSFCPHSKLLEDGREHSTEVHEERLGGYFSVTCSPLYDSEGHLFGSVHVARDINERKEAEEVMRSRLFALTRPDVEIGELNLTDIIGLDILQEIQDGFADSYGIPAIIHGTDGNPVTRASRCTEFCKIVRSRPEGKANCEAFDAELVEILSKNPEPYISKGCAMKNIITGTVPIVVQGHHLANFSIGQIIDEDFDLNEVRRYAKEIDAGENELLDAAGKLIPVSEEKFESAIKFLGILAEQIGHMGLQNLQQARFIEELMRKEETLKESEEKYRSLVESSNDAILMLDTERNIISCNRAFVNLFGYEGDEVEGRSTRIIHQSDENFRSFGEKAYPEIEKKGFYRTEWKFMRKDGVTFSTENVTSTIKESDGSIKGYVAVIRDITDKKQLEAQLQHSQKMESVGTLAGGISHDFNNLLQAIMGYTQMLLLDKEREDSEFNKLKEIEKAAERAGDLTRQLLTFSRKMESKLRPVDLNREVREVEKLLKRTIPRMISIEIHLQERLKVINADPTQVEQIIMNMGVNARDAMPEGGKLIIETENVTLDEEYCKTHLEAVPGEYVLLSISDKGHGMDRETLEHIFEPFYTTKETGKGTGLGLSMVYGIVKSHGGFIMCYSEPGEGTTFRIYFPAIETGRLEHREKGEKEGEFPGGTESILLVDDEKSIRNLGMEMLERFGYTVLTADSGESAIEIYKEKSEEISLVILDLIMPGMGGKRCLEELLKTNSLVKVVISSGYSVSGPAKEALEAGARGIISKPYNMNQMLKTVRDVLDSDE